ncbi:hypothetical protein Tco_1511720, partial [Tanacetum coccineum]
MTPVVIRWQTYNYCEMRGSGGRKVGAGVTERSETLVLLYKAAEVVLEKGFDLLGITMESSDITYLKQQNGKLLAMDHYVALPVL